MGDTPGPMPDSDDDEAGPVEYVLNLGPALDRLRELKAAGLVASDYYGDLPDGFEETIRVERERRQQIDALEQEKRDVGATDPARTASINRELERGAEA
jgi:hypothetical protein